MGIDLSTRKIHPTRLIAIAFTGVILVGTALLSTPWANKNGQSLNFLDSLFTAVSAVTVTGLATIDTETNWTMFGHVVIAILMQIGAFGIVGFGALVIFLIDGRLSLKGKLTATNEYSTGSAPDVRTLLRRIAQFMLGFQALTQSQLQQAVSQELLLTNSASQLRAKSAQSQQLFQETL